MASVVRRVPITPGGRTRGGGQEVPRGPHKVALPKGAKPTYVALTQYQQFCWRFMGRRVQGIKKVDQDLEDNLLKAHMRIRPEEYLAVAHTTMALVGMGTGVMALLFALLLFALQVPIWPFSSLYLIPLILAIVPAGLARGAFFGIPPIYKGIPASRAKKRARKIDKRLASSMSFISAMSSADVPVNVIFKELSKEKIYGEIKEEAEWITRDTELLGVDILTAIKKAAQRTPSVKFQEFLQGVITTATSGGQLKPYFLSKAEQYQKEDKLDLKKRMESLGLLAESFVTVVVAFPLFLVVIMAIMALISKQGSGSVVTLLFVVVGLMIPLSQFGFIFVIWNQEQEA